VQLLGSERPEPELLEPPRTEDADLARRVSGLEDEVARLWDALERREP
jgi:phosphate uptake regulator